MDTGKVGGIAYEPPGGQSPRNTYRFYMLGHHAWAQAKVGSLACKKLEKVFLSLNLHIAQRISLRPRKGT